MLDDDQELVQPYACRSELIGLLKQTCFIYTMTAFIVPKEHLPALKAAGFESGLDIQSYNQANVTVLVEPLDEYYCAIENVSVGQFGYAGGI